MWREQDYLQQHIILYAKKGMGPGYCSLYGLRFCNYLSVPQQGAWGHQGAL